MTKYEYNKKYIANNRDLVNQRRRKKYKQDKLNNPVDKPKQIRRRKPIEDKKTENIKAYQKAYQKEYRLKNKEKIAERQKLYVQKNYDKIAMTLEEKLIYFKEKGYVYDHITGLITSPRGFVISGKSSGHINLNTKINQVSINVKGHQFAWYMYYNEIPVEIEHINRIRDDNRIMNLRNSLKNKEKIAERQKLYVQKNYDKIAKQKTVKIKPIKPIKLKAKKQKNYLNNDDLLQQIILCKAQGSISSELVNMIQKIANGISKKLYYDNLEDKKDCIQEGITQMIINYHKFNENKYNNPLAYLSEICKRGMVKSWNEIHYRKQYFVLGSKKQTEFIQLPVINCEWL